LTGPAADCPDKRLAVLIPEEKHDLSKRDRRFGKRVLRQFFPRRVQDLRAADARSAEPPLQRPLAQRRAASRYLKALVAKGVLREQTFGNEGLFVHPKLMALVACDDSAFQPAR